MYSVFTVSHNPTFTVRLWFIFEIEFVTMLESNNIDEEQWEEWLALITRLAAFFVHCVTSRCNVVFWLSKLSLTFTQRFFVLEHYFTVPKRYS
jgi:hypothetical protein